MSASPFLTASMTAGGPAIGLNSSGTLLVGELTREFVGRPADFTR
jgi:hypothetical protein